MVRRWDPINDKQSDLLERIADGDTLSTPEAASDRRSAYALRSRGLITADKRGGVFTAAITDAGRFYLRHGRHPDRPRTPGAAEAKTGPAHGTREATARDSAAALVKRLTEAGERTLRITDPDDDTRASFRRQIHAAKQYGIVPEGSVLRHTGRASGDIVIRLLDAENPDETDWNRVRLNLRKPKKADQDLGVLLAENPAALARVSAAQRDRAVAFLLALRDEAARRGYEVRMARRGQHAKLGYRYGGCGTQQELELSEQYDEVPRTPQSGRHSQTWQYYGSTERVPSGRLQLTIERTGYGKNGYRNRDTWADDKRGTLESQIRQIAKEAQAGFDADEAERLEWEQRRAEAHAQWLREQEAARLERERKESETHRAWETALAEARPQAADAVRQATLVAALHAWRDARDLRQICGILDESAIEADQAEDAGLALNLRNWRDVGLALADRIDPTAGERSLGWLPFEVEPTADDLRPFLNGWSPDAPRKEDPAKPASKPQPADPPDWGVSRPKPWHPGRKPWW